MITPKFDPATPLHRTAMRTQKAGRSIFFLDNSEFMFLLAAFSRLIWVKNRYNHYFHLNAAGMSKKLVVGMYNMFCLNFANFKSQEVEICK